MIHITQQDNNGSWKTCMSVMMWAAFHGIFWRPRRLCRCITEHSVTDKPNVITHRETRSCQGSICMC